MNLKNIMLSKRSQMQNIMCHMSPSILYEITIKDKSVA